MVGRLIQEHQVGAAHQGLGKVQPHPPSAREIADCAMGVVGCETQAVHQGRGARVRRVAVDGGQFVMQTPQARAVATAFRLGNLALQLAQGSVAIHYMVDCAALARWSLLPDVGHLPFLRPAE